MEPRTDLSDPAVYFGSEDDILDYLTFWMKDGSPREIARALSDVARARGITEVSPKWGGGPQPLYAGLTRDGNPRLDEVMAVLDALGLELSVRKKAA
jgi:probable addiction module antidote protein